MTETDTGANAAGKLQRFHAGLLRFCKHPASILVWFSLFSLIVKEQYPFSHYPMYSGWSHRTDYYYIADADGPIQAKTVFKVSVPRMKKIYKGVLGDILDAKRESTGDKGYQLTDTDRAEAGKKVLAQLRKGVPKRRLEGHMKNHERKRLFHPDGRPLLVKDIVARDLTLVGVEIRRDGREFTTTEKPIVTTDARNQIVPNPPPKPL